jgi:hypothetical protein
MSTPIYADPKDYESPIVRIGLWFFGIMLLVISPIAGYVTIMKVVNAHASADWPTITGTVTESRLKEDRVKQQGIEKVSYTPEVRYRYEVAGRPYSGYKIGQFSGGYSEKGDAQAVLGRYQLNGQVKVYHDPNNPAEAILEPGMATTDYFYLAVGPGMLVFGAIICCAAWAYGKRAARRKAQSAAK